MGANNERPFSGAAKGEPVEQKPSFDKRFALLIDADNVSSKYIKPILDELSKYGTITYKRIYGDWTSTLHAKWKDALLDNSITPIQQFSYTVGKNATDSAMIIDAMDILYTNSVEGFCLVSSDSDFTRLASRIRESGLTVIGMGEKKTPTPFRKACDIFTTLELLIGEARRDKANGSSSSLTIEEVERAVVDIITDNQNNGKSTGLGEVEAACSSVTPTLTCARLGQTCSRSFSASSRASPFARTARTCGSSLRKAPSMSARRLRGLLIPRALASKRASKLKLRALPRIRRARVVRMCPRTALSRAAAAAVAVNPPRFLALNRVNLPIRWLMRQSTGSGRQPPRLLSRRRYRPISGVSPAIRPQGSRRLLPMRLAPRRSKRPRLKLRQPTRRTVPARTRAGGKRFQRRQQVPGARETPPQPFAQGSCGSYGP